MMNQVLFSNYIPCWWDARGGPAVTVDVDEGVTGSIFIGSDTDSCDCDGDATEINDWTQKSQILRQNYLSNYNKY